MKAIIGYGLRYTDPGRFGSEEDCKENYKRCRYNHKDQSLLQNAYEHATDESPHPRFDGRYNGGYEAPNVLYSNIATVNALGKGGKTCNQLNANECWTMPNTKYHKMLAYAMIGYMAETDYSGGFSNQY